MHSVAVYDFIVDVLRGRPVSVRQRRAAFDAPPGIWERVLAFEGCGPQVDRALTVAGMHADLPPALRRMLRESTGMALRQAALAHAGLREIAAVARESGVRVLAIKGAARLLAGELPGTRSLADLDVLASSDDAERLHQALRVRRGYASSGQPYAHHMPALTRPGALGIEVHRRLTDAPLALDADMWRETQTVMVDGVPFEVPSATNMVLHTLEHAATLNWMVHYRLRDILDVASLFTPDVSVEVVRQYASSSGRGIVLETLLSSAHELQSSAPSSRTEAWRTVRRVARVRLALATLPRDRTRANRVFRYASALAEGSPRTMMRAGVGLLRRVGASMLPALALLVAGCSDATRPGPLEIPAFVFASDSAGISGVYLFEDGNVTRLSDPDVVDDQPHSAAGRIVFMSRRVGNAEIYIADLGLGGQQRLTTDGATDVDPALDPAGETIAFVSNRSGTPRIWLMDGTGANPRPLMTGSQTFTPEGVPVWSPSGDQIAFTSARTSTSQIFVVDAGGGQAAQLSHESGGAFSPAWSADGGSVLYVTLLGEPRVMKLPASGGDAVEFGSDDRVLGAPTCITALCLVGTGVDGADADIIAMSSGRRSERVLARSENDRHPAFLIP